MRELKEYQKISDSALFKLDLVKNKLKEATAQAKKYSKDLVDEFGKLVKLQKYVVISIGFERLYKKV